MSGMTTSDREPFDIGSTKSSLSWGSGPLAA
jgi:hypothetical protein